MKISLLSTGSALPQKVLTNGDLAGMVDTNDQWIKERSGIAQRRVLSGETLTDLMTQAGRQALDRAKLDAQALDLIVAATFTPETLVPSAAGAVRERLGLDSCVAFDLNAACTGFIYALCTARGLMQTMGYKNVLVIGAEALSKVTDWTDRGTCVLFGDGAGAALLQADAGGDFLAAHLEGVSDRDKVLFAPAPFGDTPFHKRRDKKHFVEMNGKAVFKFAVTALCRAVKKVLDDARLTAENIQWLVPHQANIRIINFALSKLGFAPEKTVINIDKYGNTSAASVAIALDELFQSGKLKRGDKMILTGFGGGLTAGAILWEY